jgi:hypothetical protein
MLNYWLEGHKGVNTSMTHHIPLISQNSSLFHSQSIARFDESTSIKEKKASQCIKQDTNNSTKTTWMDNGGADGKRGVHSRRPTRGAAARRAP